MSRRTLEFLPAAIADARAAREWYDARNPSAANAFVSELDRALERIVEAPGHWRPAAHGTRAYVFRRFPFLVIYRATDTVVTVIAVAHAKRRPGYWSLR